MQVAPELLTSTLVSARPHWLVTLVLAPQPQNRLDLAPLLLALWVTEAPLRLLCAQPELGLSQEHAQVGKETGCMLTL